VLNNNQIDHFRTFGFVALPGLLGEQTRALRHEVEKLFTTPTPPPTTNVSSTASAAITYRWLRGSRRSARRSSATIGRSSMPLSNF
jgi:hypothetical protein